MNIYSNSSRFYSLLVSATFLIGSGMYAESSSAATVLVDAQRSVRSSGTVASNTSVESWSRQEMPASKYGAFNYTVDESRAAGTNTASGFASISSNITDTLFSGTGMATSSAVTNESTTNYSSTSAEANTRFQVTFKILEPTAFNLTGLLSFDKILGSSCCGGGGAFLSLRNTDYSTPGFNLSFGNSYANGDFTQNIQLSGLLDPNTYTLEAVASSSASGYSIGFPELSTGQFNLKLTLGSTSAVPLPGTVWLMLTGIMGIASRRAWRKVA